MSTIATQELMDVSLTEKEIADFKWSFDRLDSTQKHIAVLLAHGVNCQDIPDKIGISTARFYRHKNIILSILRCTADELPKAVFAALGVLVGHSL